MFPLQHEKKECLFCTDMLSSFIFILHRIIIEIYSFIFIFLAGHDDSLTKRSTTDFSKGQKTPTSKIIITL